MGSAGLLRGRPSSCFGSTVPRAGFRPTARSPQLPPPETNTFYLYLNLSRHWSILSFFHAVFAVRFLKILSPVGAHTTTRRILTIDFIECTMFYPSSSSANLRVLSTFFVCRTRRVKWRWIIFKITDYRCIRRAPNIPNYAYGGHPSSVQPVFLNPVPQPRVHRSCTRRAAVTERIKNSTDNNNWGIRSYVNAYAYWYWLLGNR